MFLLTKPSQVNKIPYMNFWETIFQWVSKAFIKHRTHIKFKIVSATSWFTKEDEAPVYYWLCTVSEWGASVPEISHHQQSPLVFLPTFTTKNSSQNPSVSHPYLLTHTHTHSNSIRLGLIVELQTVEKLLHKSSKSLLTTKVICKVTLSLALFSSPAKPLFQPQIGERYP